MKRRMGGRIECLPQFQNPASTSYWILVSAPSSLGPKGIVLSSTLHSTILFENLFKSQAAYKYLELFRKYLGI